jgi:cobalamin-dependent methionine synthase I
MHDLGVIMVSLFMHWAGFHVIYLGQNIPNGTIIELTRQLRPQVLGLSASTDEAANNVIEVSHSIMRLDSSRPLFIYGGAAFYERPDLRGQIKGQFFSDNIRRTIRQLAQQLRTNRDNSILA